MSAPKSYRAVALTEARLEAVEGAWRNAFDDDSFEAEFGVAFDYLRRALAGEIRLNHNETALPVELVTLGGETVVLADALLARGGTQIKVSHLYVGPQLWDFYTGSGDRAVLSAAVTALLANLLEAAEGSHAAAESLLPTGLGTTVETVKVYGRFPEVRSVLTQVHHQWPSEDATWSPAMQGAWLTFLPAS